VLIEQLNGETVPVDTLISSNGSLQRSAETATAPSNSLNHLDLAGEGADRPGPPMKALQYWPKLGMM
jgi:hypothetical protein